MTNQEILLNDLAAHIESLLDAISIAEQEKDAIQAELTSLKYEYKIALSVCEPWENTGLEGDIEATEGSLSRACSHIKQLEEMLNDARLV